MRTEPLTSVTEPSLPHASSPETPARKDQAFVARQPIYREDLKVFAYELLLRHNGLDSPAFANGDQATAQVLLDTFLEIGLDRVIGPHLAFVTVSRNFLLSGFCESLPKERVVLQLPEDTIPDTTMLDVLSKLATEGYVFAFNLVKYAEWLRPILALTDIVNLDVKALHRETIRGQIELLREFEVRIQAKNIETHEDFEYFKTLKFDYYQGPFICKPQVVSGDKMPANRMTALRLIAKLQDPKLTTEELDQTVSQDVGLSYKLLRYVNSAMHSLPNEVESIRHAIILVGSRRIGNWAGLILYGQMNDKPGELTITAVVRARMCQQLALATNQKNSDQFFTVGLFSVLDALLDRPMSSALDLLPLAPELKSALIDHRGLMGIALQCVIAYESGDWDQAECAGIPPSAIYDSYVDALEWTRRTMQELGLEPDLKPQESIRRRSEAKLKLRNFAEEQEGKIRQAEEESRKKVTRELLARFDIEFAKLSLEFEQRQKDAIEASDAAAQRRIKEVISEAELARETQKHNFESQVRESELERQQLQAAKDELAGLQARLSNVTQEKSLLEEKLREAEQFPPQPPIQTVRQAHESEQSPGASRQSSEAIATEIARVEAIVEQISLEIDAPATDLSAQIRLNRERSELESYVKGLRF